MTQDELNPSKSDWLAVILAIACVFLTNRWMGVQAGIEFLMATDSNSYLEIVRSAPGFTSQALPHHHAQRFFFPWVFGSFFRAISAEDAIRIASLLVLGLTTWIWVRLVCFVVTPDRPWVRRLGWVLFFWNPYTYRYYLLAPGILPDQVFQLGLVCFLFGIVRWKPTFFEVKAPTSQGGVYLLMGSLICGLSRQTSLLMIPGLLIGAAVLASPVLFLLPSFIFVLGYILTGQISASFSGPSGNLDHIIGIFSWLMSSEFSFARLAEHFLRALMPIIPIVILLLRCGQLHFKKVGFLGVIWAGLFMQPILAGPLHTTGNGSRLAVLSVSLLILGWLVSKKTEIQKPKLALCILFLMSFHHLYSVVGPPHVIAYTATQLGLAGVLLFLSSAIKIPEKSQINRPF